LQARVQRLELVAAVDLEAEVIDAGRAAALGDGEVQPRIVEHPLRVIVLQHGRLRPEQRGVKADGGTELGYRDMDMKALHATLLFELPAARSMSRTARESTVGEQGAHAGSQLLRQQFSVRYASSASIALKSAL